MRVHFDVTAATRDGIWDAANAVLDKFGPDAEWNVTIDVYPAAATQDGNVQLWKAECQATDKRGQ